MKNVLLEITSLELAALEAKLGEAGVKREQPRKRVLLLCADGIRRSRIVMAPIEETTEWFWSMALKSKNGCWEWMGVRIPRGYGVIRYRQKMLKAASAAFLIITGRLPTLHVCHICDNPPCINPSHIFLGTHQDNMDDRREKRRQPSFYGETNLSHKLTHSQVLRLRSTGGTYASIAKKFGIHTSHAWRIKNGINWPEEKL